MVKYKIHIIVAVTLVMAVWYLWYSRPVDIYHLMGIRKPDAVDILVDRMDNHAAGGFSSFRLQAGEEDMNNVLQEMESLRFRRSPVDLFQKLAAKTGLLSGGLGGQFDPDMDYEVWVSLHKGEERSELRYFGSNWAYEYDGFLIPVSVTDGLEKGRELGAFLFELRQEREMVQAG